MRSDIIYQDKHFYSKGIHSVTFRFRRVIMSAFIIFSDSISIMLSILFSVFTWHYVRSDLQVEIHLTMIPPAIISFGFVYYLMSLYPAIGIGPVEELKRLTISTSFVMLALTAGSFFIRNVTAYSRAVSIITWLLLLVSVPLSRKVFRRIAVRLHLWGIPTLIAGDKKSVAHFQKHLTLHPLTGFWPVLCVTGKVQDIFPENKKNDLFDPLNTVIIVESHAKFDTVRHLIMQRKYRFKHMITLFDETTIGPVWFTPITMVEYMGLEVVHNLLNTPQKMSKRVMELILIGLSTPALVIFLVMIAILVKISSRGPVFYKHRRIGLDGREIWIWKFRTMVYNAEAILQESFEDSPTLQEEWEKSFKLKDDPRITRIGKILRQTSLDELPQVWNVLKGEMSLIGPRPIVKEEVALYGTDFEIYKQVLPGITGLWQISGRNDLPYRDRVTLDTYYIQNWSIWLDIHILMHTVLAILQARGAY